MTVAPATVLGLDCLAGVLRAETVLTANPPLAAMFPLCSLSEGLLPRQRKQTFREGTVTCSARRCHSTRPPAFLSARGNNRRRKREREHEKRVAQGEAERVSEAASLPTASRPGHSALTRSAISEVGSAGVAALRFFFRELATELANM